MSNHIATVDRLRAPSGNRDADYFRPRCSCGWQGAPYSNRTVEGRFLAERDAADHESARNRAVAS